MLAMKDSLLILRLPRFVTLRPHTCRYVAAEDMPSQEAINIHMNLQSNSDITIKFRRTLVLTREVGEEMASTTTHLNIRMRRKKKLRNYV